jgi:hypothetical protein
MSITIRSSYDVAVSAAAAVHRDLTAGMAVCPTGLAQVADGPPLALFADGLDTAIHPWNCSLPSSEAGRGSSASCSSSLRPLSRARATPRPDAPRTALSPTGAARAKSWTAGERLAVSQASAVSDGGAIEPPPRTTHVDGNSKTNYPERTVVPAVAALMIKCDRRVQFGARSSGRSFRVVSRRSHGGFRWELPR